MDNMLVAVQSKRIAISYVQCIVHIVVDKVIILFENVVHLAGRDGNRPLIYLPLSPHSPQHLKLNDHVKQET